MKKYIYFIAIGFLLLLIPFLFSAEGDYTGTTYDTSSIGLSGLFSAITTNNTFIWGTDGTPLNKVYKLLQNGTYTNEYFTTSGVMTGITNNNIFFWILSSGTVSKFWMNGTNTTEMFTPHSAYNCARQITQNGTFFWLNCGSSGNAIRIYWMNGTYYGTFAVNSEVAQGRGIYTNSVYIWITDDTTDEVYRYYMNGTYTEQHWDTAGSGNIGVKSLTMDNTYFYSTDTVNKTIFLYYGYPDTISPTFTTIPNNASHFYLNETLLVVFTGTDETSFDTYSVNDTRFQINDTGFLSNKTIMAVGNYAMNITINDTSNNINWTIFTLQINKSQNDCNVFFNTTSPITYPNVFSANTDCSSAYTLKINGTTISNNSIVDGGGTYNISVQRTDTANYTNTYDDEDFIINKYSTSLTLGITPSSTVTYGTETTVQGSGCPAQITCNLYINGSEITNPEILIKPVGFFAYAYNTSGNENYTSDSLGTELTVNKNPENCQVLFNETSPLEYPGTFLVWANCTSSFVLTRNGTTILNNSEQNLVVGAYNFSLSRNDSSNYTYYFNETQFRIVDTTKPNIDFVSPTQASTNVSLSNIYVNVSASALSNHSVLSNVGLKLWLRFNNETGENNTFAFDYSGYGNNVSGFGGTLSNSSGKFDDCIKLNGTSYFKSTNDSSLNITNAITVSTWIKLDSYASYRRVLVKSHTTNAYPYTTYGLLLDSNTGGFSRIRMEMASGGYQHLIRSTSNLTNGVWYLVTATYNGSDNSAKIYINGVLDNSSLIKSFANLTEVPVSNLYNGKIDTNINYLTVGISSYLGDGMNGSLDDSFIYDRALSLNEIQAYYNATRLDHNITNLADGNYNVSVYAQDIYGNINSTSRWITLDTTPPIITITNPTTADENANPVNLIVSTNEVSTCAYSLDNQANVSMGTNTGFLVPITLSNGVHTIKVFCNDSLINQNTTGASISFNVYLGGGVTGTGGDTGTDPIINVTNQTFINQTIIGNESEKWDGKIELGDIKIGEFTIGTWALIGIIIGILFLILLAFIIDAIRKK